jgi:hypothetical protein
MAKSRRDGHNAARVEPRRRSEATVQRLFAPELTLVRSEVDDFAAPLPFGPKVRGVAYRFARASS